MSRASVPSESADMTAVQHVSGLDRLLMMLATTRLLRKHAEQMQKRRRFVRFWSEVEPALRESLKDDEHRSVGRDG